MLEKDDILLGSHVSFASPDYFLSTVKEALSFSENTFMFYTGAPQNGFRTPLEKCKINEGLNLLKENNINIDKIVVHAPYIINIANIDETKFNNSLEILKNEIYRTNAFNVKLLVLHPGSHVNNGIDVGINQIIKGLNQILDNDNSDVIICLETMAGKGSEVGRTFEEIGYIIKNIHKIDRIGVCLDTCHINDAGYDVHDIDSILKEFDTKIGLDKLKVIHLNDSKNIRGSHKDRHANINDGTIGIKTLYKYLTHPLLKEVPKILETPYINGLPPYKEEIELLRNFKD